MITQKAALDTLHVQSACNLKAVINSFKKVSLQNANDPAVLAFWADKMADLAQSRDYKPTIQDLLVLADTLIDSLPGSLDTLTFRSHPYIRLITKLIYDSIVPDVDMLKAFDILEAASETKDQP